jgi:hypothetical protein
LAGAAEGAVGEDAGGHVHVGVGEDDGGVLGAALALGAFAVGGGAGVDGFGDGGAADEGDGAHEGVVEEGFDGVAAAVDEADDAVGEAGFVAEADEVLGGHGDAFAGFEDEGVAGGDGVGEEPEGDHAGEVEGGDGGGDAEGLAEEVFVDAAGDVFVVPALDEGGHAAGDFDVLDAALEFADGFGEGLAAFAGDGAGEGVEVAFDEGFEAVEGLDAFDDGGVAPVEEGGVGGLDGLVDGVGGGEGDGGEGSVVAGSWTSWVGAPWGGSRCRRRSSGDRWASLSWHHDSAGRPGGGAVTVTGCRPALRGCVGCRRGRSRAAHRAPWRRARRRASTARTGARHGCSAARRRAWRGRAAAPRAASRRRRARPRRRGSATLAPATRRSPDVSAVTTIVPAARPARSTGSHARAPSSAAGAAVGPALAAQVRLERRRRRRPAGTRTAPASSTVGAVGRASPAPSPAPPSSCASRAHARPPASVGCSSSTYSMDGARPVEPERGGDLGQRVREVAGPTWASGTATASPARRTRRDRDQEPATLLTVARERRRWRAGPPRCVPERHRARADAAHAYDARGRRWVHVSAS